MKSMTGFGRADITAPFGKILVEIQSVNRKYLEVHTSLPKEFLSFETELRQAITEKIHRGTVSVRFVVIYNKENVGRLLPDFQVLKELKKGWESLAVQLGYTKDVVEFAQVMEAASSLNQETVVSKDLSSFFLEGCLKALAAIDTMRQKEGSTLGKDLMKRLKNLKDLITQVEKLSPKSVAKHKEKIKERMKEFFSETAELDERIVREVAIYSEKIDVSEEISRFRSHILQFSLLFKSTEPCGRKMDFLTQEMGREINTIGSKSLDSQISVCVVELKSELEKIREQVQNIE
jgi:uncharacterized protein (TIGR00255 family)